MALLILNSYSNDNHENSKIKNKYYVWFLCSKGYTGSK
jgi:hypothetical protein